MPKKVGEFSSHNELTGEVNSHYTTYVDKHLESFIMIRTTIGKEWFYALSNNQKNLLMMLWDWSRADDMSVYLGTIRRREVMNVLGIGKRQITSTLSVLCASNYVKRIGRDDFLVNPTFMFKCPVKEVRHKIKNYEEYVVKHKNSDFYSE